MMTVAIAATMIVGFASCSEDEKPEPPDVGSIIKTKWLYINRFTETGVETESILEFKRDYTYFYENLKFGNGEGNYQIFDSEKSAGVISYPYNGNVFEEAYDGTLYKLLISSSNDFDQIWVYHYQIQSISKIIVEFYSNNERVETRQFGIFEPLPKYNQ